MTRRLGSCVACRCKGRLCPAKHAIGTEPEPGTARSLKAFADNAGAVALLLGVVLSLFSLYDILIRKPEADRISAITQFNQAVNSAAKTRQDLIQANNSADQAQRLAVMSMATPRILNDVATAKALLPTLEAEDVGVPQLLILITEAMTAGDLPSAESFIERALSIKNLTPLMKSEALRYRGKFQYVSGDATAGRASYKEAISSLGLGLAAGGARAYALGKI